MRLWSWFVAGLSLVLPAFGSADTIFLKNGEELEVGVAWREGDVIKGTGREALVQFPAEEVARIEEDGRPSAAPVHKGFRFDV